MRANIDLWLAQQRALAEDRGDNLDGDNETPAPQFQLGNVYLGARQLPHRLGVIEERNRMDPAFTNFTARLTGFVNTELRRENMEPVEYGPTIEVS